MRTIREINFIFLLCFLLFLLTVMGFASESTTDQEEQLKKTNKSEGNKMLSFTIDTAIEQTKADALEQYKSFPPLHPERFRRKVKMVLGVDIRDYPEDALIWFGRGDTDGVFNLSVKYQTISGMGWPVDDPNSKDEGGLPFVMDRFTDKFYHPLRGYLLHNDTNAYKALESYANITYDNLLRENEYNINVKEDLLFRYDALRIIYDFNLSINPIIIGYIDLNKSSSYEDYYLNTWIQNKGVPSRVSDIKKDLVSLFIIEQMRQGREFTSIRYKNGTRNVFPENGLWVGSPQGDLIRLSSTWQEDMRGRNIAAQLSFLVQLQDTLSNRTVIEYMSGQIDRYMPGGKSNSEPIRDSIRSNNYYGYAVLREFCENPEREMPTLEKVGTSFKGIINNVSEALLYLEPFSDSYDIDTIWPNETFIAYEMGHDDYFFVEVVKPVESPIAGPDGYAMILDRTETVYGYIRKMEVREYTDTDTLSQTVR